MKFSSFACLTVLATSASVADADWSSYFKGKTDAAGDMKAETPGLQEAEPETPDLKWHRKLLNEQRRLSNNAVDVNLAHPSQTFYVPLPEKDTFNGLLKPIAATNSCYGKMISMISVAISTDNTVIWYDHWEDGYDQPGEPLGIYSETWGDGDASNGCRPDIVCNDLNDVLMAGDTFILRSEMHNQRSESGDDIWSNEGLMFDGRDKLKASYPITMTRGGYAQNPGSLLAGAVEVHDTSMWGTEFHAPVGEDTDIITQAFEWTRIFIMASELNTVVDLPDGSHTVLNEGQSYSFNVKEGAHWKSSKPIQAFLCAGDIGSNYEMRWFSLLPVELWSSGYYSPLGDSHAFTKMAVYNPNDVEITVELEYRPEGSNQLTTTAKEPYIIPPRATNFTRFVPTHSAGLLTLKSGPTDAKYIALSITDTEKTDGAQETLNGQCYDWGFPVVPISQLTPQVVVGWGYGCTENDCIKRSTELVARSAVWVAPMEDAIIHIDYNNDGTATTNLKLKKLQSAKLRDDDANQDMSGAVIWATKDMGDDSNNGPPVDIAAAWGQDPAVSRDEQSYSLDLGTCVLPFATLRVSKEVDKTTAYYDDTLTYTIKVMNVGQKDVVAGDYTIVDPMMGQATYVEGSTKYSEDGGKSFFAIADDAVGTTKYPLDEDGLPSQRDLLRRGGTHHVQFSVTVTPTKVNSKEIVNTGWLEPPYGTPLGFQAKTKLEFRALIEVENKVYLGDEGETGCGDATKSVTDVAKSVVTYCFKIKNAGSAYLDFVTLENADLGIPTSEFAIPMLAPGDWITVTKKGTLTGKKHNEVTAKGWPVFKEGDSIPGLSVVEAMDPSDVDVVSYDPVITIRNTVYQGHRGSGACNNAGDENVRAEVGAEITYCFKVKNQGNTYLTDVKVVDPIADNYINDQMVDLAPGESALISYAGLMPDLSGDSDNNLENMATVTATPSFIGGAPIGIPGVSDEDPSSVSNVIDTETKTGEKPPGPPIKNCMENAWHDANNSQNLVCRAKEVYLNSVHSKTRGSCQKGGTFKIVVDASIHYNSARYDNGWYVATDGGDALDGHCYVSGLKQKHSYNVMSNYGTDAQVVGSVQWNNDFKKPNDSCGDVITDGGGGADILVPFIEEQDNEGIEVACVDHNNDGVLDVSVCFSWRVRGKDSYCTMDMNGAEGELPDLYPATPSKCFCARYDIPEVTVDDPPNEIISPC